MAPVFCTLTGVDEKTDIGRVGALSAEFPFVEWGMLVSMGNPVARFPGSDWRFRFMAVVVEKNLPVALHMCGGAVDDFLQGDIVVRDMSAAAGRVQLNFNNRRKPVSQALLQSNMQGAGCKIIIQEHAGNAGVNSSMIGARHQVLFDASGGRGVSPELWPAPLPGFPIQGYAGGLSPENVDSELPKIARAAGDIPFWIDMETSLRDADDSFCLDRCERVLRSVASHHAATALV